MQSWNWPAIKKCFKLVGDRGVMKPNLLYRSKHTALFFIFKFKLIGVKYIDWRYLKDSAGVNAVCFDKDNTLTVPYGNNVHDSIKVRLYFCGEILIFYLRKALMIA